MIDEQHRFGVEQRAAAEGKGFNPHLLVMTATPIPRTLALTIYGDLDVSVLDELPPGRQAIKTRWIPKAERAKAYKHMRREIGRGPPGVRDLPAGRRARRSSSHSADETYEQLQHEVFPDLRVALIHGKMTPARRTR